MNLTYNIELESSEEIKKTASSFLLKLNKIFNSMSKIVYDEKPELAIKILHDRLYFEHRRKFPKVPSQFIIKCEQEIKANYRSVKSNKHKITQPINKNKLSIRLDRRLYSKFTPTNIKINIGEDKRIDFKLKLFNKVKDLFAKYRPCDPLLFSRNGKIFLAVSFEVPETLPTEESYLGIDLGLRRLFATSDGKILKADEYCKYKRKIRYLKRMLQKKHSISSKNKLKKIHRKEANFSKNYIHNAVNEILTTDKSVIVLEDLSTIKIKKNKYQNINRKSQIPFGMITTILSHKAPLKGKRAETVNPSFTSQNDSRRLARGKRQGCRYYAVDGAVLDADVNAACNIAQKFSKHPISFRLPIDGNCDLIGRLLSQRANRGDNVSTSLSC